MTSLSEAAPGLLVIQIQIQAVWENIREMRIKSICFLQLIKKVSDLFLSHSLAQLETSNFCFPNHKRDYKISLYVKFGYSEKAAKFKKIFY